MYHFINAIPEMQEKYEILKQRKGHNTAKAAMTREMFKIIYHVLKEQKSFYLVIRTESSLCHYTVSMASPVPTASLR